MMAAAPTITGIIVRWWSRLGRRLIILTGLWIQDILITFLLMASLAVLVQELTLPFALMGILFFHTQNDFLTDDSFKSQRFLSWYRMPVLNLACINRTSAFAHS
jgi:hypothetical protein